MLEIFIVLYVNLQSTRECPFLHLIKEPIFYLIHSDVWGPSSVPNISGACWFVIFVDDCTRVVWLYLLKTKSKVGNIFSIFYNMINNQFGIEIKRFRFDNAKNFFNQSLFVFFQRRASFMSLLALTLLNKM